MAHICVPIVFGSDALGPGSPSATDPAGCVRSVALLYLTFPVMKSSSASQRICAPQCRFKHTRLPGPPPEPSTLEAAKPREHRNINIVANQANEGIIQGAIHGTRRLRQGGSSGPSSPAIISGHGDIVRRRGGPGYGPSRANRDRARSPPIRDRRWEQAPVQESVPYGF